MKKGYITIEFKYVNFDEAWRFVDQIENYASDSESVKLLAVEKDVNA